TAMSSLLEAEGVFVSSLRRGEEDDAAMQRSLGELYVSGARVAWNAACPGRRVALPTYPFQRARHWIESKAEGRNPAELLHPLLGERVPLATDADVFQNMLSVGALPYLKEHQVAGNVVVSAGAFLEMARAAVEEALGGGDYALVDVVVKQMLVLPEQ